MQITSKALFPSLVWSVLFDDRVEFNAKILAAAHRLRDSDTVGESKSNVNGWQSKNNLQNLSEFDDLNLRIIQVCQRIAESQNFMPNMVFQHQAWLNFNQPGASNKLHYHPNCHFSGIYYISLKAPECGSIYFRDPRIASRMLPYPSTEPTEFTAEELRMPPQEGRMYVFPGWLEHGVEVNDSDQDRISIAFNVLGIPRPPAD